MHCSTSFGKTADTCSKKAYRVSYHWCFVFFNIENFLMNLKLATIGACLFQHRVFLDEFEKDFQWHLDPYLPLLSQIEKRLLFIDVENPFSFLLYYL